ncbi:hypothetical protein BDP27DRAFT_1422871 [Rhodocollybia butyracea]|uniref:Uncharacterized protein n=1 Tax=Rhodocollybia butyracea TaxID=206335 RepID=A0A9P5U670_9AGAR|nr:hypothetical protein BDP27DRAFT_1422871 [Rhodocollybia butyracea]
MIQALGGARTTLGGAVEEDNIGASGMELVSGSSKAIRIIISSQLQQHVVILLPQLYALESLLEDREEADTQSIAWDFIVQPYFASAGFDILTLINSSIADAPQATINQDLGIDKGLRCQTRNNIRRRNKRRCWSANKKARADTRFQAELPFAEPATAHTTPLPVESPPASPISKFTAFLQPLTRLTSPPSLSTSKPVPHTQSQWNSKRRETRKRKAEEEAPDSTPSKRTLAEVLSPGTSIKVEAVHSGQSSFPWLLTYQMEWRVSSNATLYLKLLTLGTSRTPFPLIDSVGRIIGVLPGQPGSGYTAKLNNRGWFPAFNCGVSMGMGNPHPVQLDPKNMKDILERLVGSKSVRRMAMYQNAAFPLWAPRVYEVYEQTTNTIWDKMPGLRNNFSGKVFGAATFNFGGNIWTFKHRDFQNWPFSWCAITALGKFDPARSAQLILWELKASGKAIFA